MMAGEIEPMECFENPVLTKHGDERLIAWHNTVLNDSSGRITGTLSSGEDITDRERMVQELDAQRTKAIQADRLHALGEMAAGVAHELNQPLTAISTLAEGLLLRHEAGIPVSENQINQQMEDTLNLVNRMSDIIDHMRVFARDTSEEDAHSFRIPEVIQNAFKFIQAQLKVHGVSVHLDIAEDLPECSGWPNELERALLNLISNAQDAMGEREKKIEAGAFPSDSEWAPVLDVQARYDIDGKCVRITVSDTGGGIPEAILPSIFNPFFTTKEAGQGTGLGLSISAGIVEKHGGKIALDNRPGDGATFCIVLPIEKASD